MLLIKACINDKVMCHSDTLWSHWMLLCIYEFANNRIVKISNFFICGVVFDIHVNIINIDQNFLYKMKIDLNLIEFIIFPSIYINHAFHGRSESLL